MQEQLSFIKPNYFPGNKEQSRNDSTESLERIIRAESSNRRRTLMNLNEKIKLSNLEKIYKLNKTSSFNQSTLSATSPAMALA